MMNRNNLFDKIFTQLYKQKETDGFFPIYIWAEKELGIDDEIMLNDIIENMFQLNWIDCAEYSKHDIRLTYTGRKDFEKYGSYSSFEVSENSNQKKVQRKKTAIEFIKISSAIIFGLLTVILGWTKYYDDKTIQQQNTKINELNIKIIMLKNRTDSLKNLTNIQNSSFNGNN